MQFYVWYFVWFFSGKISSSGLKISPFVQAFPDIWCIFKFQNRVFCQVADQQAQLWIVPMEKTPLPVFSGVSDDASVFCQTTAEKEWKIAALTSIKLYSKRYTIETWAVSRNPFHRFAESDCYLMLGFFGVRPIFMWTFQKKVVQKSTFPKTFVELFSSILYIIWNKLKGELLSCEVDESFR